MAQARWPGGGDLLRGENISTTLAVPMQPSWSLGQHVIAHLLFAIGKVPSPLMERGLHLEFGVFRGDSLRTCARKWPGITWHGFDSFKGLPSSSKGGDRTAAAAARAAAEGAQSGGHGALDKQDARGADPLPECLSRPPCTRSRAWTPGKFSVHGALPRDLPPNVALHVGWFNETLGPFLDATPRSQPVAFCHLDADLYISTILVLDAVFSRCRHRRGSVFAFDELFGSVAQLEHEYRALKEATLRWGVSYRFVSYAITQSPYTRAAVQITHVGSRCASREIDV